jgi:hypothetical protein
MEDWPNPDPEPGDAYPMSDREISNDRWLALSRTLGEIRNSLHAIGMWLIVIAALLAALLSRLW